MSIQEFVQHALFGGHGSVVVRDLLGPRQLGAFRAVLECTLEAGGRVGLHKQQEDDELVLCLSGTGQAEVDGVAQPLSAGALVWLPFGSSLALQCDGEEPLHYLILKARRLPQ